MLPRLAGSLALGTVVACLPPEPPEILVLALDVQASQISGGLTLNGGAFPGNQAEMGMIALYSAQDAHDALPLAPTIQPTYQAFVVNGVYEFRYLFGTGGAVVPTNQLAAVLSDQGIATSAELPVDVGAVAITPVFTVNGNAFPASPYETARFYLQPVGSDARIFLGDSHTANAPVRVVPGSYHVIYEHRAGALPRNKGTRVRQHVVLDGNQQLAIDVVASAVRPALTLNGNAFPASEYNDANFYLRDELTGVESLLMNSHAPVASVPMIDGTYDLIYRHETGDDVPRNTAALVVDDFVLAGVASLVHDLQAVTIDATVTLNHAPFPVSEYDDGIISLHDARTDTVTELGNTHSPFTDLVLIPGTYDVLYSHETGDEVPQNVRGTVAHEVVIGDADLNINVVGVQVGADITLDGEPFPASEYDDATFVLAGAQSAEDIVLGHSHEQAPSVMVMAGTYDLFYRHDSGDAVPRNRNYRLLAQQALGSDTTLGTNIATRFVRLAATLNHAPFPAGMVGRASILAQSHAGDDVVVLETGDAPGTTLLITGDYDFYYRHAAGLGVPRNPWAYVGASTIE